jgi:hypothetical protein
MGRFSIRKAEEHRNIREGCGMNVMRTWCRASLVLDSKS